VFDLFAATRSPNNDSLLIQLREIERMQRLA